MTATVTTILQEQRLDYHPFQNGMQGVNARMGLVSLLCPITLLVALA